MSNPIQGLGGFGSLTGYQQISQQEANEALNRIEKVPQRKPPMGPEPEYLYILRRIHDLQDYLIRYATEGHRIDLGLLNEYNKLIFEIENKYPTFIRDLALAPVSEQRP